MKLLVIAGLALLPLCDQTEGSAVSHPFLKEALVTDKGFEPLTDSAPLSIQNRNLILEPGVRAQKNADSFTLSTHDHSSFEMLVGSERLLFPSPLNIKVSNGAWDFGTGKTYANSEVLARRTQDDTDTNLKSMQESAKKLKSQIKEVKKSDDPNKKTKVRLLMFEYAELFNKIAIQMKSHQISPIGF